MSKTKQKPFTRKVKILNAPYNACSYLFACMGRFVKIVKTSRKTFVVYCLQMSEQSNEIERYIHLFTDGLNTIKKRNNFKSVSFLDRIEDI